MSRFRLFTILYGQLNVPAASQFINLKMRAFSFDFLLNPQLCKFYEFTPFSELVKYLNICAVKIF